MSSGRSDASTSTDDIKNRPLCLFYFTHPFGVLSPEPPTVTQAPPHIARTFIDMKPVAPYSLWCTPSSAQDSYDTNTSSTTPKVNYDLGNTTVHRTPVNLASVAASCSHSYGLDFDLRVRRDSLSSSLFSSDLWFNSNSSSNSYENNRRLVPYNKILPPLQLPMSRDLSTSVLDSAEEIWPKKWFIPEKFSLPPIDMPKVCHAKTKRNNRAVEEVVNGDGACDGDIRQKVKSLRRCGGIARRARRGARLSGARRTLTTLMYRAVKGGKECSSSPALQEVLNTIREAWTEPKSLRDRCRTLTRTSNTCQRNIQQVSQTTESSHTIQPHLKDDMLKRNQLAELPPPRPGASPGLLRRRYSMPETIMRKYRLAQQRADSDDSGPTTSPSPASMSPPRGSYNSLCDTSQHRFLRRDRELMRKSALLRRMWGRPCNSYQPCCCCSSDLYESQSYCGRETRSLDGSRSELRHMSSSYTSSRHSHVPAGWATPKRQRLESQHDHRGSDEMLRAAMRNSYDKAEESRSEKQTKTDLSDSTYQSHNHGISIYIETSTDAICSDSLNSNSTNERKTFPKYSDKSSGTIDQLKSDNLNHTTESDSTILRVQTDDHSITDSSDTFSTSVSTAKETNESKEHKLSQQTSSSGLIDGRVIEGTVSVENDENNVLLFNNRPVTLETPSYEILEIVVSETVNTESTLAVKNSICEKPPTPIANISLASPKNTQNIDIDEYVSNILVESLNSLTDQLESMNATICSDRKISIVEKEIKVKLQNTGVNTIVHLSPTSNNQIIFGNEELYNIDEQKDNCNNIRDGHESVTIREEAHSVESNNNVRSADKLQNVDSNSHNTDSRNEMLNSVIHNENVNKAVLQQIQKLFQDELHNVDTDNYAINSMPSISHIEISNVDVYIDNNTADTNLESPDTIEVHTQGNCADGEVISGVGAGNYFQDAQEPTAVPRFSAFPNTDSMEVNTSSSDDAELMGSDTTSLVDSLDDPNSPRSVLLRKSFHNNKRSELVRSAIDVLDLLPETAYKNKYSQPREKSESFFIRIKDNDCDCEKENVIVADHMPERIKEKLYRRQRKREQRMESARRSKVKQLKRELDKQRHKDIYRSKVEIEKDCMAIINMLIDDVIVKIAQDEYKYLRIKQKSNNNKTIATKSDENLTRKHWKNDAEFPSDRVIYKTHKSGTVNCSSGDITDNDHRQTKKHRIHGKLSLQTHPPLASTDGGSKRFYQKSEIHEGNKCIEILEILEYIDTEQSSPETTNSDENHNHISRNKKSRIPIPVYERIQKTPKVISQRNYIEQSSPNFSRKYSERRRELLANALLDTFNEDATESHHRSANTSEPPTRRASVPQHAPRSRSNSLRFKRVFDIIPEEKSSLSLDSSNEDINYNRTVSAPNLSGNQSVNTENRKVAVNHLKKSKCTKSVGTSPLTTSEEDKKNEKSKSKTTMTSPIQKSAATSPLACSPPAAARGRRALTVRPRAWLGFYQPERQLHDDEGLKRNSIDKSVETDYKCREQRSVTTQYDLSSSSHRTVRTIQSEKTEPIIVGGDKTRKINRETRHLDDEINRKETKKKKTNKFKSEVREHKVTDDKRTRSTSDSKKADVIIRKLDKQKIQMISLEKSEEETVESVKLPEFKRKCGQASSSDSESGGSLLCSLAPKWLSHGKNRRQTRRRDRPPLPSAADQTQDQGGWSVTVAGSCHAALPADVEMRLRFPDARGGHSRDDIDASNTRQQCSCRHCEDCSRSAECAERVRRPAPPPPPLPPPHHNPRKLTLTMKKEALDSSILASKSRKKSTDVLPDLETFSASRSKTKSTMKMRRGYSLHCWLPEDEPTPIRTSNGLSVLGCAIIPELKPRVPTMSERDVTRAYTPRHYLRS